MHHYDSDNDVSNDWRMKGGNEGVESGVDEEIGETEIEVEESMEMGGPKGFLLDVGS